MFILWKELIGGYWNDGFVSCFFGIFVVDVFCVLWCDFFDIGIVFCFVGCGIDWNVFVFGDFYLDIYDEYW